jgi:broad specificity phosphatase PhoE
MIVQFQLKINVVSQGVCEGLTYEEMQDKYPQEFAWRDQDKLRYRYPWGESYVDIMARLDPVLLELEHENNVLVVSHQAVLRCILGYFLNKKPGKHLYNSTVSLWYYKVLRVHNKHYHFRGTTLHQCASAYSHQDNNRWL